MQPGRVDPGIFSRTLQVLRDWRVRSEKTSVKFSETEMAETAAALSKFMNPECQGIVGEDPSSGQSSKKKASEHLSNRIYLQAVDHALQGIGSQLSNFAPKHVLRPLRGKQRRYWVPAETIGPVTDPLRTVRCCIEEEPGGKRYLELPAGPADGRAALHMNADRGPTGNVAIQFLYNHADHKIRGSYQWDHSHIMWGDVRNAMASAGLKSFMNEATLCMNVACGPWHSDAFSFVLREGGMELLKNVSLEDDSLFPFFYDKLCKDFGISVCSAGYGTSDHMGIVRAMVFDRIQSYTKGIQVRLSRFFTCFTKARVDHLPIWWSLAYVIVYVGLRQGWWSSLAETPFMNARAPLPGDPISSAAMLVNLPSASAGPQAAAAAAGDPPRGVAVSNDPVDALRRQSKNQLHLAAQILCNGFSRDVLASITLLVTPFEKFYSDMVTRIKTRDGVREWLTEVQHESVLNELFNAAVVPFSNTENLHHVGFIDEFDGEDMDLNDAYLVSRVMVDFAIELLGKRVLSHGLLTDTFPGCAARLVGAAEEQTAVLEMLSEWFETLTSCEEQARDVQRFTMKLLEVDWVHQQWPRELLFSLAECEFKNVPEDVRRAVLEYLDGICGSLPNENVFNTLRRTESESNSKIIGRVGRWHACVTSPVAEDWDRQQVAITPSAASLASTMSKLKLSCFEAEGGDFSLSPKAC